MLFYVQCNDMQQLQQARCPVSNISTASTPLSTSSAACDTPNVFEAEGVSEEKEHSHSGAFCFEALVNEDNLKCIEDELRAKHAPNAWAAAILSLKEKQEKERSTQAASAVDDDARLLELAQLDSMRWTDMD